MSFFHPSKSKPALKKIVCRQSKEEHDAHVAALGKEDKEMEEVFIFQTSTSSLLAWSSIKALAHSLDEHKRLVAAKQNQELLLANHFKSINLGEPTGQDGQKCPLWFCFLPKRLNSIIFV